MDQFPDLELRTNGTEPPPTDPRRRQTITWIVVAILIAAAAVALYVLRRPAALPMANPTRTEASPPSSVSLGGQVQPVAVPPLGESDPLVRSLVRALSAAPAVVAWLTTNNLIRNFTVVVSNIAEGSTPQRLLGPLHPSSPFQTSERDGRLFIDLRTYARYDGIADAVASIDPAAAASVYATLKPRISEAYAELGPADPSFDRVLERSIVVILATPIVDGPVGLKPKGIGYAFADDRLENLSGAQRQLLRMGPRNSRIIQEKIRAVALALGMKASELPPQR
jgi:Protein of unknown function (DUF3014)